MNKIVVIPDIHFGLQPTYVQFDYPRHILDVVKKIINDNPDATFILTGDVFHNAGIKSYYSLEEHQILRDLQDKGQLIVVKGNGKHCYDIYKQSPTFESVYGIECDIRKIGSLRIGLIGYFSNQVDLHIAVDKVMNQGVDIIVTHNFLSGGFGKAVFPEVEVPVIAGHDHSTSLNTKTERHCIGSVACTDFGSASTSGGNVYAGIKDDGEIKFYFTNCIRFETWEWTPELNLKAMAENGSVNRVILPNDDPALFKQVSEYADVVQVTTSEEATAADIDISVENLDFKAQWEEYAANEPKPVIELGKEALDEAE